MDIHDPFHSRTPENASAGPRGTNGRFRTDPRHAHRPDPALAQIRAYWEALRAGRSVPLRAEIDPRGLENALDRAFMLERVAERVARVRLAGSHANALMGMEVRGMPLSAMINPDGRDTLADALKAVFDGPSIAEVMLDARRSLGRPPLSGRMLILPLMSDSGRIDRALGYLGADGAIGRTPRRFDITMTRLTDLAEHAPKAGATPAEITRPDHSGTTPTGFAEPRTGYAPPPARTGPPGRPHLRLVKTDRDG